MRSYYLSRWRLCHFDFGLGRVDFLYVDEKGTRARACGVGLTTICAGEDFTFAVLDLMRSSAFEALSWSSAAVCCVADALTIVALGERFFERRREFCVPDVHTMSEGFVAIFFCIEC